MKKRLYINFFILIIIPVLIIIVSLLYVANYWIFHSEIKRIDLVQENVKNTLTAEVSSSSLALSHYLHVSGSLTQSYAEQYSEAAQLARFGYMEQLENIFRFISIPKSNYYGVSFFMKNGEHFSIADSIIDDQAVLRQAEWYRLALERPGQIRIVGASSCLTYNQRKKTNELAMMVAVFAPKDSRGSNIEAVTMYTHSDIGSMIKNYKGSKGEEYMYLMDEEKNVLIGKATSGEALSYLLDSDEKLTDGLYKIKTNLWSSKYYKVKSLPIPGWMVINVIDKNVMMSDFSGISMIVLGIACLIFILFFTFLNHFLKTIIDPIQKLIHDMQRVDFRDMEVQVAVSGDKELQDLGRSFNTMIVDLKAQKQKAEIEEQEKHEAQMRALRAEINPHFLVNTLNSIRYIAMYSKFETIQKIAEALIEILSRSFRSTSQFYTVESEISALESYIYIMKIRYTENFDVTFQVEESTLQYKIPHLLLQPIVENSIVHGFEEKLEAGEIIITITETEDKLNFVIRDNGKGMNEEEITRMLLGDVQSKDEVHIGITNVKHRIELLYGEEHEFKMSSIPGMYLETVVILPKKGGPGCTK